MFKIAVSTALIAFSLSIHAAENFTFQTVVNKARQLRAVPYKEPDRIPRFLRELSYSQYQDIRFDPDQSLWRQGQSLFQVMLIPPGSVYDHTVKINIINTEGVQALAFKKELFTFNDPKLEKLIPNDMGYAGVKLTFPFFEPTVQNQFLVFAGASYFRGVGKHNGWGISSRGIAVDTGLPSGEEFPAFVEFWLKHPAANSKQVVMYGLLDGPSLVGAYQFTITPGVATTVDIKSVLFPRSKIKLLGVAPLTSMFFYGENTMRPRGEWRSQVHDSDGLLIHDGDHGEWLWRPLINPVHLQMDYFNANQLVGFGLLQRDNNFNDYHDLEAHYEARPSIWITPKGNWGPGKVVLVQLPTRTETNDNIVAFWTPANIPSPDQSYTLDYQLRFGGKEIADQSIGHVINTFVGDGNIIGGGHEPGAVRFIVDFAGAHLEKLPPNAKIEGIVTGLNETEVIEHYIERNPIDGSWRLSLLARPAEGKSLELRAYLRQGEIALTETWSYRLPPENDIRIEQQ